jgi:hypothetical protein
MDGNALFSSSSIWDAISFVTKKLSHVSHLASTSISSLRHMSACLGQSSRQTRSRPRPLVKGDHPELDDSAFLDEEGIQQYQWLIGQFQWTI